MTDFERSLVNAFNDHFDSDDHEMLTGYAKRDQQSQYVKQLCDVILWKPDALVECKSVKTDSASGLGFRSHFNVGDEDERHQIKRMADLTDRCGVKGILALELRHGRGKPREAYLIDFSFVYERWYDDDEMNSIRFRELEDLCMKPDGFESSHAIQLVREDGEYQIDEHVIEWIHHVYG